MEQLDNNLKEDILTAKLEIQSIFEERMLKFNEDLNKIYADSEVLSTEILNFIINISYNNIKLIEKFSKKKYQK